MKLSPLDIRKHEFSRGFRGYDPEEVRPFLDMVSQQWDELLEELRVARDRARELESKIGHYEKVEEALQQALESARSTAQRTQVHAEERAKLILEEAELRAEQVMRDAEQDRFRLRQDVSKLTHRHAEVTARLRHFLMSELEILAQHEDERPIGFMKLIPAREADALPSPTESRTEEAREPGAESDEASSENVEGTRPAEAIPHAPDARTADAEEERSTTYADMYARAATRSRGGASYDELGQVGDLEAAAEEEEPTWNLRQIVAKQDEDFAAEEPEPTHTERDRIRRIIEDLD